MVEFVQDKCDILDKYKVGENVSIGINLRGKEWINPQGETKYFNSIQGWKISKLEANKEGLEKAKEMIDKVMPADDDDLPF